VKKQKNIQVPVEFLSLTFLLLEELDGFYEVGGRALDYCERLRYLIDEKFAALNRRNAFSAYITALPGSHEREALRRAYLDLAFCHPDWRSVSETLAHTFDDDVPF
jgi:hypothetical protein